MTDETRKTMAGPRARDKKPELEKETVKTEELVEAVEVEEPVKEAEVKEEEEVAVAAVSLADAVTGFATYLSSVKTFRAGTRGDSGKLSAHASRFCEENGWGSCSEFFPENVKMPKP